MTRPAALNLPCILRGPGHRIKNGDNNGLKLDLSGIDKLLDGSAINPNNIYGTIYVGPYPLNLQRRDMNIKDLGVSQVLKMVWAPLILHRY